MEQNNNNKREAVKVVQTAGRDMLGDIAPEFARLNDDVLFGEVWSRNDKLSLRDRSMVTVATVGGQGDGRYLCLPVPDEGSQEKRHYGRRNGRNVWAALNSMKKAYVEESGDTK